MHNGLSIYQNKFCEATFFALPRIAYITCNRPVVGKTKSLCKKSQQSHCYCRIANKLIKHINICCCTFNKISVNRKKTVLQDKFDLTINFDLMINLDFFDQKAYESLMV